MIIGKQLLNLSRMLEVFPGAARALRILDRGHHVTSPEAIEPHVHLCLAESLLSINLSQ